MKNKKRLKHYLLFGSLFIALLFTFGCKSEVLDGDFFVTYWVYDNKSSYDLTIKEFGKYRKNNPNLVLQSGEILKERIEYFKETDGTVKLESIQTYMPFCRDDTSQDSVLVVNKKVYNIVDSTYFRNLDNYEIVTEGSIGYTFTYTFTDSIISEIIGK